jgi:AbrB family looped-hinge helix DNA binding protein
MYRKAMDVVAKVTSKGQVTLPKAVRDALAVQAGDQLIFRLEQGVAVLAKTDDFLALAGSVSVPPEARGIALAEERGRAWRARAERLER